MKKISIIVPVYNREKQIQRCIDSLVNQTYENIQIILVNDGSKDRSKEIIDMNQKKHPDKIIAIHTENQGVSMARNEGIQVAQGDYIGFVDSDDYVDKEMFCKLIEKAEQDDYDMVACNTWALYPKKKVLIDSSIHDHQSTSQLLISAYAVLWNKIYKRELIQSLRFKKDVWYEDVLFLYEVYPHLKKVGRVEEALYYYVQNEGSITYTYNEKLYQLIENMDDILQYYHNNHYYDLYRKELEYSYVRYLYGTFIKRLAKSKDFERFKEGCKIVIDKVNEAFPEYRKNLYINQKNGKSLYLKLFSPFLAYLIYFMEKNRMN